VKSADQCSPGKDEGCSHDQGAQNAPEENPVVEFGGDTKIIEYDDKDKNVVHAQGVFD
jgi:hypothetical protein